MKRFLALGIALTLVFLSGCTPRTEPESQASVSSQPAVAARQVTDPAELDQLWRDYFSLAIIPLQHEFSSPQEMDPGYLTTYCWYSYARQNGGTGSLTPAENGEYRMESAQMAQLMQQYFNWAPESFSGTSPQDYYWGIRYDETEDAFFVTEPDPDFVLEGVPSGEGNPWGIALESFCYNGDGTATAILSTESLYIEGETGTRDHYTMGVRAEGDLYFQSMETERVIRNLSDLKGNFTRLTQLDEAEWIDIYARANGSVVTDDSVIIGVMNDGKEPFWHLERFSPDTWESLGALDVPVSLDAIPNSQMAAGEDGILLFSADGVKVVREDLSGYETVPLPEAVQEAVSSQAEDAFFGGYDVTGDLNRWLYCDSQGLKFLDLTTGEQRCLSENELRNSDKFGIMGYQRIPRFLDGGTAAMCTISGYEWTEAYVLTTVDEPDPVRLSGSEWSVIPVLDKGLILVRYGPDWSVEQNLWYSFEAGEAQELDPSIQFPGEWNWVFGEKIAAFVDRDKDYKREDAVQTLCTFRYEDGGVSSTGVTATLRYATDLCPLAMLPDGRILCLCDGGEGERQFLLVP